MTGGRKKLLWIGTPIGLVLLVLILVPVLFEDRIEARARTAIERRVDAHIDWRDAGLSLLRDFPHLTLRLEDLTVTGRGAFEGDTLAAVHGFRLVLDIGSVLWGDQTVIRSIDIDSPVLHLLVLEDGTANWDIARSPETAGSSGRTGGLDVGLRGLAIRDGWITFDNRGTGLFASLDGVDHSLRGDFTRDSFGIETHTHSDAVIVRSGGIPYLGGVALDVDAEIEADLPGRRFTFGDNVVKLNDLELAFTGSVAGADDGVEMDVEFASPGNDFRSLLSLVPAMYAADFQSLQTSGVLSVEGHVSGRYGEQAFPAIAIAAKVDDGSFQYPDLPLPAREIFLDLAIDNPGGDADSTIVNVRRLHARIGDDPIEARLALRTPLSDPDIDLAVSGVLDLAAARQTFRLETVEELAGIVNADVAIRARKSVVEAGLYDRIEARGDVVASNVALRTTTLPHAVTIDELSLGLAPRSAELRTLRGTVGSSDVRLSGTVENLVGFAMGGGDLRGNARFESDRFDLTEWESKDSTSVIPVPPRLDFTLRTAIAELRHGRLDMTDARGLVHVRDQRLTIDSLRLNAVGGEFRLSGYYETTDPAEPVFDMDVAITDASVAQSFEALTTVRLLAPVARYAEGRFSTRLQLNGALGADMAPILGALTGRGALETSQITLLDFPPMQRLAEALSSQPLRNPALRAVRTAIEIRDGRLHVRPFDVGIGASTLTVGGSNGIDRSLDYDLVLALPQSSLETGARQALGNLFSRAGATVPLDSMSVVRVGVRLTGTIDNPAVDLEVGRGVETAMRSLEQTAQESIDRAAAAAAARADSARADAIRQAEAEAARIIDEAEQRAALVRAEARELAGTVRSEANLRADSLVARATSPVARLAASRAANELRNQADRQADGIIAEADSRADGIVTEARRRADALVRAAGGEPAAAPVDTAATRPAGADTTSGSRTGVSARAGSGRPGSGRSTDRSR